jgi:hypothetical protein
MTRDTCVHYQGPGYCRARSPTCAHHYDGACRVAGKLEERPPAQSYGIRFSRRSPEKAEAFQK